MTWTEDQKTAARRFRCLACGGPMVPGATEIACPRCAHSYPVDADGIVRVALDEAGSLSIAQRLGQWAVVANQYDSRWRRRSFGLLSGRPVDEDDEQAVVADAIDLDTRSAVLDNACGNAFYGRALAWRMIMRRQRGFVIANDLSLPMLRKAKALAEMEGVAGRMLFVRSDSEHMPFRTQAFDAIVCGGSMNEFRRPNAFLREASRVLDKRAGRMSIMVQTLSSNVLLRQAQRLVAVLSGLTIEDSVTAVQRLRKRFRASVRFHAGIVAVIEALPLRGAEQEPNDHVATAPASGFPVPETV